MEFYVKIVAKQQLNKGERLSYNIKPCVQPQFRLVYLLNLTIFLVTETYEANPFLPSAALHSIKFAIVKCTCSSGKCFSLR